MKDDELARLLEAHVRFEVDRWQDDRIYDTARQEVDAGFDLLGSMPLRDLVPQEAAQAWIRRLIVEEPLTDAMLGDVERAVRAAHGSLLEENEVLAEVLPRERYEQIVSTCVAQQRIREDVLHQLTTSSVYAQLVSHVLYQGLKSYLLTDNSVVRRVPGASSLLRMGQNAVRSATPHLEAGIDRRLLTFVASSMAETLRDSRRFLEETLDDATLRKIADEVWDVNGQRTMGALAGRVGPDSPADLVATTAAVWLTVRSAPVVTRVIDAAVQQFYRSHGDEPATDVLARWGATPDRVADGLARIAVRLRDSGRLEAHVRRRLEAFYSGYSGCARQDDVPPTPTPKTTPKTKPARRRAPRSRPEA